MENTKDLFSIIKEGMELKDIDASQYSPLTLAYIGDAVYDLLVRTMLVDAANTNVNKLSRHSSRLVNANAQSNIIKMLMDELTDEEISVFKRGRNAKSNTKAKNASLSDYRMATGFETLIGYLYLCGRSERILELINQGIKKIDI